MKHKDLSYAKAGRLDDLMVPSSHKHYQELSQKKPSNKHIIIIN